MREKYVWQEIRSEIESNDRPHHIANMILRRCRIELPPIPIYAILKELNLKIEIVKFDSSIYRNSGMDNFWLARVDSAIQPICIYISSLLSVEQQKFAVCHSLGHVMMDPPGVYEDTHFGHLGGLVKEELRCNDFAASLLVPWWILEPLCLSKKIKGSDLHRIFGVTPRVVTMQLEKLV